MNWIATFKSFFESRRNEIGKILDARGCREGWIQGEMFLHMPFGSMQTNDTTQKYDLVSVSVPMFAEIKVCGGDYQPKMMHMIEEDVAKLQKAPHDSAKYFILLIDTRNLGTRLGKWLLDFQPESEEFEEVQGQNFKARIWKLKEAQQTN